MKYLLGEKGIGSLDRKVTLKTIARAQDAFGGVTETQSTIATVWAKKDRMDSQDDEKEEGGKSTSFREMDWIIRYRTDVDEDDVLIDEDSQEWDILAKQEMGRRQYLRLITEKRE